VDTFKLKDGLFRRDLRLFFWQQNLKQLIEVCYLVVNSGGKKRPLLKMI